MTSKHHTRSGYEQLYVRLTKEIGRPIPANYTSLSDYHLLSAIDKMLIKLDCVCFTQEELEMDLH